MSLSARPPCLDHAGPVRSATSPTQGELSEGPLVVVTGLGLVPCFVAAVRIGGKSPTEDLAYFLLGYFFLTNDTLLSQQNPQPQMG